MTDPAPPGLAEIAQLLRAYDESTAALQATHDRLQREVARLSGELQRKNDALVATLDEVSNLKDYLADIIDNDASGVAAVDRDGRIMAFNPAAREIVAALADAADDPAATADDASTADGRDATLRGRDWTEAFPGAARPLGEGLMRVLADGERRLGVEWSLPGRDGTTRYISMSIAPVITRDRSVAGTGAESEAAGAERSSARRPGELTGAVAAFQDMTQYRQLAERARRNERLAALGEMAAGVAHEIRNPLGGIELYASNLGRKLPEGPLRATCGKIIAAAARLNRIVTDLLSFTRSREPTRRPSRVESVVRLALDGAAAAMEAKDIGVTVDCTAAPDRYALDPDLLSQAFLNIVLNATQAMEPGGHLRVVAALAEGGAKGGGALQIRFEDDGPGIPAHARDKLFNPFFTMRAEGTGLGLAITHKIVRDHDGSISVEDAVPHGAVFVVELPVRPMEGAGALTRP